MNPSVYKKGILYVNRTKFYLYIFGQKSMYSVDILPTLVKDLEIVDKAQFDKFVSWFISTNHIPQASLSIVLGEGLLFRKKLVTTDPKSQEEEQKAFINTVPFERTSSQVFLQGKQKEVVAVNADFVVELKKALEKRGFSIKKVIPTTFLGEFSMSVHSPDIKGSVLIQRKLDGIKSPGMSEYVGEDQPQAQQSNTNEAEQTQTSYPLYLLAGFGVLFIVLGIMIFWQVVVSPQRTTVKRQPTFLPTPSVIPTISILISPTTTLSSTQVSIRLTTTSSNKQKADALSVQLKAKGYDTINTMVNEGTQTAQPLIIFSPRVSLSDREAIQSSVTQVTGQNLSIKENNETAQAEVIITL